MGKETADLLPPSPINVITGTTRSCGTVWQNLLNQNPDIGVSSTSTLVESLATHTRNLSKSMELKGALGRDREGTEAWVKNLARSLTEAWHPDKKFVFDKSHFWMYNLDLLWALFPNARVIVCLRDLRDVWASYEKHYIKNGSLDYSPNMMAKTMRSRLHAALNRDTGDMGQAIGGVLDMIDRLRFDDPRVILVKAEDFTAKGSDEEGAAKAAAELYLRDAYKKLNIPYYEAHDFEKIVNTATDPDHLRLFQVPHEGCGEIRQCPYRWSDYMAPHIGKTIMENAPLYFLKFGYAQLADPRGESQAIRG